MEMNVILQINNSSHKQWGKNTKIDKLEELFDANKDNRMSEKEYKDMLIKDDGKDNREGHTD